MMDQAGRGGCLRRRRRVGPATASSIYLHSLLLFLSPLSGSSFSSISSPYAFNLSFPSFPSMGFHPLKLFLPIPLDGGHESLGLLASVTRGPHGTT